MAESPLEEIRSRLDTILVGATWGGATPEQRKGIMEQYTAILTAAERMAGENDKLRGYALATEQLAFGPPFPRQERYEGWRGDWRKKHGITPEMMGGDVCHDPRS